MKPDVAFLHTSPVHVATFAKLMHEVSPLMTATHVVREDLLAEARRAGVETDSMKSRIEEAMTDAGASGAPVVMCTCSTIGGVAEAIDTNGAFIAGRIDRAMADEAVRSGSPILIVAALASTIEPTLALLRGSAKRSGTDPKLDILVVEAAWTHFERGDLPAYFEAIVEAVIGAAADARIVVLAQASMAEAAVPLAKLGITALSSPRLGVERAVALHAISRS